MPIETYRKAGMIILSLLVITMLTLFIMNQYTQNELVNEIQESSTEISKAIQISVEDLTSGTDLQQSRLMEYLKSAKNKGINEINIISNEGEIINSTDPAKVGKRRDIKKMGKGRTGEGNHHQGHGPGRLGHFQGRPPARNELQDFAIPAGKIRYREALRETCMPRDLVAVS